MSLRVHDTRSYAQIMQATSTSARARLGFYGSGRPFILFQDSTTCKYEFVSMPQAGTY